jgi:hypothetical protein
MPLVRHADLNGRNCFVGRERAAREMSVSPGTIFNGWAALKAAGYLALLDEIQVTSGGQATFLGESKAGLQNVPPPGLADAP